MFFFEERLIIMEQQKFNIKLGMIIRKQRQKKGLSRNTLAQLCDINEKYLGKIERGESSPSCFIIKKISIGLKIKISQLTENL